MRIKACPEDFIVEEQIRLPTAQEGNYILYRVRKRDITTLEVQERLAKALRIGKERIAFPALKDKDAVATQFVSVELTHPGAVLPALAGSEFEADPVGRATRPLRPGDLRGNQFTLVVRDLALAEAQAMGPRLRQASEFGIPNYFDAQRFGSYAGSQGFIGKKILQRDAEGALRIYLAEKMAGDTERVRVFKTHAQEHWSDWSAIMERAPKPSNFRSVLTYLKDHPSDYRRALNLIPHRLLTLYLSAYQSWLWNLIAARFVTSRLEASRFAISTVRVAGQDLPVYYNLPEALRTQFDRLQIPLPNHRATYADPELAEAVQAVLGQEGLSLNDFKARILKKAFASKSSRALIVHPERVEVSDPENDDLGPRRWRLTLRFQLPPGSYATLVVKAISNLRTGRLDDDQHAHQDQ